MLVSTILYYVLFGRYKVRKEPSPAKRCEKMRKESSFMEDKQALLYRTRF